MADIKISELEPTTDLEGLYTIGSDKNNLSKKVSLQFLKDAANYANEQGDYAKQAGDTVNGNVGVSDYPEFSASQSYVIGDIVRYNGVLYAFTANHAASAWNGSDVKATSINAITSGKLTELESDLVINANQDYRDNVRLPFIESDGNVIYGGTIGQQMTQSANSSTKSFFVDLSHHRNKEIFVVVSQYMSTSGRGIVMVDDNNVVLDILKENMPTFVDGAIIESSEPTKNKACYAMSVPNSAKTLYISLYFKIGSVEVFVREKKENSDIKGIFNELQNLAVQSVSHQTSIDKLNGATELNIAEEIDVNKIVGSYRFRSGTIEINTSFFYSEPIEVKRGDIILIQTSGYTNDAVLPICRVDTENNYIAPRLTQSNPNRKAYKLCCDFDGYISLSAANDENFSATKYRTQEYSQMPNINVGNDLIDTLPSEPLKVIKKEVGFVPIIRSWGFIGDSLSSGEQECYLNGTIQYLDMYEYSWGQHICRLCSAEGYNFSQGGQTARGWCQGSSEREWGQGIKGASLTENAKQAYIIALGFNDANDIAKGRLELGSIADVKADYNNNADSFYGWYAGVIQRVRSVEPKSIIFVTTIPNNSQSVSQAIREIADLFPNVFVIDLEEHLRPFYLTQEYRDLYLLNGHQSPVGYLYSAYVMMTYIDWIIRKNPSIFRTIALVGTDYTES